jgi:hypothetical protein
MKAVRVFWEWYCSVSVPFKLAGQLCWLIKKMKPARQYSSPSEQETEFIGPQVEMTEVAVRMLQAGNSTLPPPELLIDRIILR